MIERYVFEGLYRGLEVRETQGQDELHVGGGAVSIKDMNITDEHYT